MTPARILIADDHELLRRGLVAELSQVPGWDVVAAVANGRAAVASAAELKPDLVVLDLTMPELNGLEAARRILAADPATRILILTAHESEQLVREVLSVEGSVASRDGRGGTAPARVREQLSELRSAGNQARAALG